MTRRRWSSENEVASPVVPRTLSPSQPLARRKRASATDRTPSGSPLPSTAVAIAAITPSSDLVFVSEFVLGAILATVSARVLDMVVPCSQKITWLAPADPVKHDAAMFNATGHPVSAPSALRVQ